MIWELCLMHIHQNENSFLHYHVDIQWGMLFKSIQ